MADRAKKISELPVATVATGTDLLAIVANTAGVPVTKQITAAAFFGNTVIKSISTPANGSVTSVVAGTLLYDSSYVYIATANNVLKRIALEAF